MITTFGLYIDFIRQNRQYFHCTHEKLAEMWGISYDTFKKWKTKYGYPKINPSVSVNTIASIVLNPSEEVLEKFGTVENIISTFYSFLKTTTYRPSKNLPSKSSPEEFIVFLADFLVDDIDNHDNSNSEKHKKETLFPLAHNLPTILSNYLPRPAEDQALAESLSRGHKHIFITADVPGIGKTEFIIAFATALNTTQQYEFFYSTYDTSLRNTIIGLHFHGWSPCNYESDKKIEKSPDQQYEEKINLLRTYPSNAVLIIDNFDGEAEKLLAEINTLPNLDMRLIFTSRVHFAGKETIVLPPFDAEQLTGLMQHYFNGRHIDEDTLNAIIAEVDHNTLIVDVLGRLLGDEFACIDPKVLLLDLKTNKWNSENLSENISSEYLRDNTPKSVFHHLNTLFNVSKIDPELCHILSCACFLPTEGLNFNLFSTYLSNVDGFKQKVRNLCNSGWIRFDKTKKIVKIHPMLRAVCVHNELTKPKWPGFKLFWEQINKHKVFSFEEWNQKLIMLQNCLTFLSEQNTETPSVTIAYALTCSSIGDIYDDLGDFRKALTYKETALSYLQQVSHNIDANLIEVYIGLSTTEGLLGNYEKAYTYANQALQLGEKHLSEKDMLLVECYLCMGDSCDDLAKYDEAHKYIKKAANVCASAHTVNYDNLARCYEALAISYYSLADYTNAEKYAKDALDLRKTSQPLDELKVATAYNYKGFIQSAMGLFDDALECKKCALEIRERLLPKNHILLAVSYSSIGFAYYENGDYPLALTYLKKSLDIKEKNLGLQHPETAKTYSIIGDIYLAIDRNNITPREISKIFNKAIIHKEKALSICKLVLPSNHPTLADLYCDMGVIYTQKKDYDKALYYEQTAKAIYEACYPNAHPARAAIYRSIASSFSALKQYDQAVQYALESATMFSHIYSMDHIATASAYETLGDIYWTQKDYNPAIKAYTNALSGYENTENHNHPDLSLFYAKLTNFYTDIQNYPTALEFAFNDLQIQENLSPRNPLNLASILSSISYLYQKTGRFKSALNYSKRALDLREKNLPKNHSDLAHSYGDLIGIYQSLGDNEMAFVFGEKAMEIWDQILSETDVKLAELHTYLAWKYEEAGNNPLALEHYLKALTVRNNCSKPNDADLIQLHMDIGNAYWAVSCLPNALEHKLAAYNLICMLESPAKHDLYYICRMDIGDIYAVLGDMQKAAEYWAI